MNLTSVLPVNVAAAEQEQQQQQSSILSTGYITDRFGSFNISSGESLVSWNKERNKKRNIYFSEGWDQHQSSWCSINSNNNTSSINNESVVESANSNIRGMPRAKRRAPSSTNHHAQPDTAPSTPEDNPRHPSKRLRHTSSNWRRNSKQEDASCGIVNNATHQNFSSKRCVSWFREYTTPEDPDMLGPEGMEKFCEDLGVEPENIVMLVLAYKMGARCMGYFSLSEWLKGLDDLQCDSMNKLKNKLDYLRGVLNDPQVFKAIYRYAYDFARQDKDQRSMDMETARIMLQLLLGKHWPLFPQFGKFLEQSKYRVINKDQWYNILEFSRSINQDLSNYDLDGAWPVMLDEFVEWLKTQREDEDTNKMDNS